MVRMLMSLFILSNLCFAQKKNVIETNDKDVSLTYGYAPEKYRSRPEAVYNVALLYYGNSLDKNYLDRLAPKLISRFNLATQDVLKLNVVLTKQINFLHPKPTELNPNFPAITDFDRLHRLWYYDHVNSNIMLEIHKVAIKDQDILSVVSKLDAILAVTGAQFEGLGYANGRIAVTENPREIAWGASDGGTTQYESDEAVIDELIHELGHTFFLDHSSKQCFQKGMDLEASNKCCEESPSRNDTMSYCRERSTVSDKVLFGFSNCSLGIIKSQVVPALLQGSAWAFDNMPTCN
jgi:hypothetical protein